MNFLCESTENVKIKFVKLVHEKAHRRKISIQTIFRIFFSHYEEASSMVTVYFVAMNAKNFAVLALKLLQEMLSSLHWYLYLYF